MDKETVNRVARAIEESGLTDEEIAELTGVHPSTSWRWRTKRTKNYSVNVLQSIANATGVRLNWLRFGKGEMHSQSKEEESSPKGLGYDDPLIEELRRRIDSGDLRSIIHQNKD